MDMTGYGYRKRVVQSESASGSTEQGTAQRSSELSGAALRLLVSLDTRVHLSVVPAQFPRVLNKIAEVWDQPVEADRVFNELLLDGRGGRQGFPALVIDEISRIRAYHLSVYPKKIDPWDQTHLR